MKPIDFAPGDFSYEYFFEEEINESKTCIQYDENSRELIPEEKNVFLTTFAQDRDRLLRLQQLIIIFEGIYFFFFSNIVEGDTGIVPFIISETCKYIEKICKNIREEYEGFTHKEIAAGCLCLAMIFNLEYISKYSVTEFHTYLTYVDTSLDICKFKKVRIWVFRKLDFKLWNHDSIEDDMKIISEIGIDRHSKKNIQDMNFLTGELHKLSHKRKKQSNGDENLTDENTNNNTNTHNDSDGDGDSSGKSKQNKKNIENRNVKRKRYFEEGEGPMESKSGIEILPFQCIREEEERCYHYIRELTNEKDLDMIYIKREGRLKSLIELGSITQNKIIQIASLDKFIEPTIEGITTFYEKNKGYEWMRKRFSNFCRDPITFRNEEFSWSPKVL